MEGDLKIGSGAELVLGNGLNDAEKELILDRVKQESALGSPEVRAEYLLDVVFARGYSLLRPSGGIISYFKNGAKDAGGQTAVYLCPGEGCRKPMPDGAMDGYCPSCDKVWDTDEVDSGRYYKLGVQGWATAILKVVRCLGMNADIRLIYPDDDIRSAALVEQESSKAGELMGDVRRGRAVRIYRLSDIVKDTSNGADLYGRVLAFLKA